MDEMAQWLSRIGLGDYASVFQENDIDFEVLPDLTEAELETLGLSLGHRKKLMRAITALGADAPESTKIAAPGALTRDEADRRQLTIMFVDLVGSTELSTSLDPEVMRELIQSYRNAVAAEITRFEGHVAKFLGDGVLAYFGWPRAHEDEAERAIRAGLRVGTAVAGLTTLSGAALVARVGIATGLVVVGDLAGEGEARERAVTGQTPNLAARLQGLAEPGSVVIAEETRALARGAFAYADLGAVTLKGIPKPVRAWRVCGEIAASRFEAAHTAGMGAFVGRDQEVELLHSRWEQATGGEGQVVLLCGEGGIGKSRIAEQLRLRIGNEDHVRLRYQCSPFHLDSPLHPAIAQLEYAAKIGVDNDDEARLAKLETLLRPSTPNMDVVVPLFAALLGIPLDGRYAQLQLTADVVKRRTLEALADQLVSISKLKPVFWLIEDAHWLDPTTRDLIGLCLGRIRDARVFILVTFRPEFTPPWTHLPHVTALNLNRLGRRQCAELIERLCGGMALPAEVQEQLIAKTDGIPLFIEEMTKTVLESGLLGESQGNYVLVGPMPPMAVPASLQDSLMARLDRLSAVKEVTQIGAAIGREFTYELLLAVTQLSADALAHAMSQLVAAELVFVRGEPPEATYIFKHGLLQDAAYASLLRVRRQQLHARIAQAIEEKLPDAPARQPEILAHHYEAAGIDDRAKEYWTRAGKLALSRMAFAEAINHLNRAQALAAKAELSEARAREESALILDRALATANLKGSPSSDHGRVAEEAVKTSESLGDDPLHFRARWAGWAFSSMSGNLPLASERADVLVAMANRIGADDLKLQAYHARWTTACLRGQLAVTRDAVEHGLALYDFRLHRDHWSIYGSHDPGVCARGTAACVLWQMGLAERANAMAEDAIHVGAQLGHPFSRAIALWHAGLFVIMVGDVEAAAPHAKALTEVANEASLEWPASMAQFISGWAMSRQGLGRGAQAMETVFHRFQETKQRAYQPFFGTLLANAKLEMGQAEAAMNLLDEVQLLSVETHQQMFLSDLHRVRAEALRSIDPKSERIGPEFQTAMEIARRQGALALELRAATGLAGWLADSGRRAEGHGLLSPVYRRMTEGFGTPDLKVAKLLLDALA
jgi:class 3 adenylate cyclase